MHISLVIPIIVSTTLAIAAVVQILASPRVLERRWLRVIAVLGLFVFVITTVKTAPDILDSPKSLWYELRWLGTATILAILLRVMSKLEKQRVDIPLRKPIWKTRSSVSAKE